MKIMWGELANGTEHLRGAMTLPQDVPFQNFLLSYAEPFMKNWDLPVPRIYTIQTGGSCYDTSSNSVFLNLDATDQQARRANKNLTPAKDSEELAALFCLCHELTHAVQVHFLGIDKVLKSRLLMETHADTVAGYWLAPQLGHGVAKLVGDIAFSLDGKVGSKTHPPGCTRQSSVIKGMSIGAAMLLQDENLTASISSRDELFRDSLATAEKTLNFTEKPCDMLSSYSPNISPELCSSCPKAKIFEATT